MNYKHLIFTLMVTLLLVTTINAADTNTTNTQSDTNEVQVTNTNQLSNTIESLEKDKSTIKLEEGNYDSFNINWDRKDKELIIDGNNQKISGEISITVSENSKLTINSLTLNHTGLNIAKIINNGKLHLNNVHLTTSNKINLSEGYSYDSLTPEDQEEFQDTRRKVISEKNNTSGITIINNNRLTITNSIIDDNHVQGSIITNNYITSINNISFRNNYAESLFDNNAKLLINNTIIDKDNIYSLVKVGNTNTTINPEVGIINSQMSYNQLENYIIDDTIYSKILVINSTFNKVIAPYWFMEYDEGLYLEKCGDTILADNRVYTKSYIDIMSNLWGVNNTITFSQNNQTKNIWKNYDETKKDTYDRIQEELKKFQKYFTDNKEIPIVNAYYNTNTSSLKVNITSTTGNKVDGTVIIIISNEEGETQHYTIKTNDTLNFNDSTVNDASEINIIFKENNEYYKTMKTYTLHPVTIVLNDYEDEEYTNLIPELELSEIDIYDLKDYYMPGEDMNIYIYFSGEEPIKSHDLGKIHFSFDKDTVPINMSSDDEIEITYHIPEDIEFGEYEVNATFKHPEYITSQVSYYITITNETEEDYFEEDEEYLDEDYEEDYPEDESEEDEDYSDDEFDEDEDDYSDEDEDDYSDEDEDDYSDEDEDDYSDEDVVEDEDVVDDEYLDDSEDYPEGDYVDDEYLDDEEYSEENFGDYVYPYEYYNYLSGNTTINIEKIGSTLSRNTIGSDKKQIKNNVKVSERSNKENITSTGKPDKPLTKIEPVQVKHSKIKNYNRAATKRYIFKKGTQITLTILNKIFGINFSNQTIQVYINGRLVYNGTVTDNLVEVLFEITGDYNSNSTLKVVTEDKYYTENIIII